MQDKKTSYFARLLAVVALITAIVVMVVAIGAATSTDEGSNGEKQTKNRPVQTQPRTKKKVYKVQSGDSLTVISEKTGVPVERLERLNPGLDPQTLQPGQKLKLR